MASLIKMLLSALPSHGHPSLARASRAAGSGDPWPVKATDAPSGPPSPHNMGQGGKLSSVAGRIIRGMRSKMISCCLLVKTDAPSIQVDQGRKLALLVDFDQQALFPEPSGAPPEIGKEHLTRLAKGHLTRLGRGNLSGLDMSVSDTFWSSYLRVNRSYRGRTDLIAGKPTGLCSCLYPCSSKPDAHVRIPPRSSASPFLIMARGSDLVR